MEELKIQFCNRTNPLAPALSGLSSSITRKFGHPFLIWNPFIYCLFTETEFRRLHRRFWRPSTDILMSLLKLSALTDANTRSILEGIVRPWKLYQIHTRELRRFKFALRTDRQFNDTILLVGNPYCMSLMRQKGIKLLYG